MFCRFKEGLATLDFLNALEQHPALFMPFMCYSENKLTADALESLFRVQLSPPGSTMRQEETRSLNYWQDYLLYVEGTNCYYNCKKYAESSLQLSVKITKFLQPIANVYTDSKVAIREYVSEIAVCLNLFLKTKA